MRHDTTEHDEALRHDQRRARRPSGAAPLGRPRAGGRLLGGVAAGIARFVGADVRVVRVIWAVSLVPSLGITALGYLALWLLLPLDAGAGSDARRAAPPAPRPSTDGAGRSI